jgi:ribosomal protein S18 acetylase RimI-like enzyme
MLARIRPVTRTEEDVRFLRAMLYEAVTWRGGERLPLEAVLSDARTARYVEGWGRVGDDGVVAMSGGGTRLGAAWFRLFAADEPGHGFVAASIPELSIAVVPSSRGRGIGSALLSELGVRAREAGFSSLSLSVEEGNRAARLYERAGFVRVGRQGSASTMLLDLS